MLNDREHKSSSAQLSARTPGRGAASLVDNRVSVNPIQRKANNTGLPDSLKSGIENLSGHSMDDVKVHYNSSAPAQLNAHAYAQGNQIHVAPGQEKHLPHEAWHVVQQKEGRVKPTMQMKGKVNVNDDSSLEKEADVMGAKALRQPAQLKQKTRSVAAYPATVQLAATVAHVGGANPLVNYRALGIRHRQRQLVRFGPGYAIRERIYIQGNPHFSRNLGHIVGNGNNETRPSVPGVAHSEPILIGRTYGLAGDPTWPLADAAVDAANLAAGGAAARNHFALFTERVPCPATCALALANARFDANDTVNWNYNNTAGVTASHIARARLAYPNYHVGIGADFDWLLVGWRLLPAPVSLVKQQPPKKDDEKKDDGSSKKQTGQSQSSAFGKSAASGFSGSGTASDPIMVD